MADFPVDRVLPWEYSIGMGMILKDRDIKTICKECHERETRMAVRIGGQTISICAICMGLLRDELNFFLRTADALKVLLREGR